MREQLENYCQLVASVGREPDSAEFLAWAYLDVKPEWFKKLVKSNHE